MHTCDKQIHSFEQIGNGMIRINKDEWLNAPPHEITSAVYTALLTKRLGYRFMEDPRMTQFERDLAQLVFDNVEFI